MFQASNGQRLHLVETVLSRSESGCRRAGNLSDPKYERRKLRGSDYRLCEARFTRPNRWLKVRFASVLTGDFKTFGGNALEVSMDCAERKEQQPRLPPRRLGPQLPFSLRSGADSRSDLRSGREDHAVDTGPAN